MNAVIAVTLTPDTLGGMTPAELGRAMEQIGCRIEATGELGRYLVRAKIDN